MNNYKTLIILDWDDTLFPTSWTIQNNIDMTNKFTYVRYMPLFEKLDTLLFNLLTKLQKHGTVAIVTNAATKWIKISSVVLPKTQRIIASSPIQVISAREILQDKYPNNMHMWKKIIFDKLVIDYFAEHGYQHIISVGDAEYEFLALVDLYNEHSVSNKRLLKTVRFMSSPSFESLVDQLNVLHQSADKILTSKKHMDLKFKDFQ